MGYTKRPAEGQAGRIQTRKMMREKDLRHCVILRSVSDEGPLNAEAESSLSAAAQGSFASLRMTANGGTAAGR